MKPTSYFLYHLHSDYSLLDSVTDFKEYVDLVKSAGGIAIAFAEHGFPRGWISKKMYCDEQNVKFVHGVEVYLTEQLEPKIRDNYHTVLLARNMEGVRELNSLMRLSSDSEHFYYVNRLSFDEFLQISDNIIKTSACLASPLSKLETSHPRYVEMLRHYDYLEVQPHCCEEQVEFNKKLARFSKEYKIPLIVGTDTHSSSAYKAECRSILSSAKRKNYENEDSFDLTYKTVDELIKMFEKQGALTQDEIFEAIENTNRVAELCQDFQLDKTIKYPVLYGSAETDEQIFEKRAWDSLEEKMSSGVIPEEQEQAFREAITEELRVFKKLKMSGFMLSMSDLIRWCKQEGMAIGTARGSVGGSRVAYVTDIIDLNPETWHTVFSRFCNEDREEVGDIDVDVVYDDRSRIFEYITERFGESKTARVAAYGTLASVSVIDEVCRALSLTKDKDKYSLKVAEKIKKEFSSDEAAARKKYPEVFYYYDGLVGTRISQSIHPAGMVISPITLDDNYGTFEKDGEVCLLMDMEEAHEVGVVKYDFLALKTVKVIRDTCDYIGIPYPKTNEVNWNDEAVWNDMCKNQTAIFQFESKFAADCFKRFKPKSIFDMCLVTACIRPSGESYREDLLARKKHKNPSDLIDELLKDNLGYLVFQEDTISFLQQICGLSGSEADNIRRAIGRKQKDRLDKAMPSILEGYCSKSSQPREIAEQEAKEFLKIIEDSASYQFGYNHALAYCLMGYICGYFRYYYPMEFTTAFLNNSQNSEDISNGTKLMKLYNIKVSNPKFGTSKGDYFFDKENRIVYKGLGSVKYMSSAIADELYELSNKKTYTHFVDLLSDINAYTTVNSRQIDILIKIDFFSKFGNQRELLRIYDVFELFKKGSAKQIKKELVKDTPFESIVKKYANGKTKDGTESKSYVLSDVLSIMRECEQTIKNSKMSDLSVVLRFKNFAEIMGYEGYVSGVEKDRPVLYVKEVFPLRRKKDNAQFGHSIVTQSVGSGIESRFTVFNKVFDTEPIKQGDTILCMGYQQDGAYFTMTKYKHIEE